MINNLIISGRVVDKPVVKEFMDKKGKGRFVSYFRIANVVSKDNTNFFEVIIIIIKYIQYVIAIMITFAIT